MRYIFYCSIIFLNLNCSSDSTKNSVTTLTTFNDSTSYTMGADYGENLKRQGVELNYDVFLTGLMDGMETNMVKLDQNTRRSVMGKLQKNIRNKSKLEAEKNLKIAENFLNENKRKENIKVTPTGLQYRVINEGEGPRPDSKDRVKVHYVGNLIDGTQFDSSIERGEPTEFRLDQVIRGWTEGLQLMSQGSKYEFFIHPRIAYGNRPRPTIPANSVLVFEVELLEIMKQK